MSRGSSPAPRASYAGIDNLEALEHAVNYNRFLTDAIVEAAGGRRAGLDFGAGSGSLAKLVRERGLGVACVEPDPELRGRLRSEGFLVHDDIALVPGESQGFIYSINVLEHIEDDAGALRALWSALEPGGRCFLYVPALPFLYSSMDRKIGHFRRYRRSDLVRSADAAGFVVERVRFADSLGVFVTLLYKLVGSRRGDISTASVRIYDRAVFPASRVCDRLGCSRLFGKNLAMVMRRPDEVKGRA